VILFVIHERYGSITWEVEYKTAKQIGKPFLILCLDDTHNRYIKNDKGLESLAPEDTSFKDILTLIQSLYVERRSPVPFSKNNFSLIFKKQLSLLLANAAEALQKENRKEILLNIVRLNKDYKKQLAIPENKAYLMELLSDVFEKKEVRKQVLECFCENEYLKLNEEFLQNLVYDPEQGVQRRTVQLLPRLFHEGINKDSFFDFLLKRTEEVDDSGFDRRLVVSLLEIDFEIACKKLKAFPMSDIGIPRRIIGWFNDNYERVESKLSGNEELMKDITELKDVCKQYEKGPNVLKTSILKLEEWLNSLNLG
jgi:hypothetical protein